MPWRMGMAMHALTVQYVRVIVRSPCPPDSALRRRASRESAAARRDQRMGRVRAVRIPSGHMACTL